MADVYIYTQGDVDCDIFCHQDIATYVTFGDTCTWGKVKLQNFLRTAYNSFSLGIECLSIC